MFESRNIKYYLTETFIKPYIKEQDGIYIVIKLLI